MEATPSSRFVVRESRFRLTGKGMRSVLDNQLYVERRLAQADADAARVRVLVAQNMRRFIAIRSAVIRIGDASRLIDGDTVEGRALLELLAEISKELEEANRQRSTDLQPE